MDFEAIKFMESVLTTRQKGRPEHKVGVCPKPFVYMHNANGDRFTADSVPYREVIRLYHMEYYIVISRIEMMPVTDPIRSPAMNLYVAGPEEIAHFHFGVEEIGATIPIEHPRINDLRLQKESIRPIA
mgnify:FL=1